MKKISILFFVSLLGFSCSKENPVQTYEVKEFVPMSNNNANYLVQSFLKKVPNSSLSVASKTNTVVNKEPNESIWIIEGASNFERKTRTFVKSEVIDAFEISIDNFTDSDGLLKINEAELISKYASIQSAISSKESTLGKLSKIVNMEVLNISNSKTDIKVTSIYGNDGTGAASSWPTSATISESAHALREAINTDLAMTVSNPAAAPQPAPGTDWLDGDYVWYGGIVAFDNPTSDPTLLDAWDVNNFCSLCLYASDLINNPFDDVLYDYFFQSIPTAAQQYVDDNFPTPNGQRPVISLMIEGTQTVCTYCPNIQFHFFENITTANAYYWVPDPTPGN